MQSPTSLALDARLALDYLKSQLVANHDAAAKRYKAHVDHNKLPEEYKLSYAWADYTTKLRGGTAGALRFSFGTPSVSFICDHDALLQLKVRAVRRGSKDVPLAENFTVTYRVITEWRAIIGKDEKVGDHESRIRLLVFDLEHADLVRFPKEKWFASNELERHLATYLRSLQAGGHHVLFVPPEFDANDLRAPICFSLSGPEDESNQKPEYPLHDIDGYTADMINDYLSLLWYTCAYVARERGEDSKAVWDASLAEYRTWLQPAYTSDWHSFIKFGAPKVEILCGREVILYFPLNAVTFYHRDQLYKKNFEERDIPDYTGWTIAVIVNVTSTPGGVKLELETGRCSVHYSTFDPVPMLAHEQALMALIEFFNEQYLNIVGKTRLQYLFYRLRDDQIRVGGWSTTPDSDGSWWMLERGSGSGGSSVLDTTIRHTNMYGFDVVFAISQMSINMQLRAGLSGKSMIFPRWDRSGFVIEVKSVNVRLLNGRKAIVVVNILEGSLTSLLNADLKLIPEADEVSFGECRLAFEVPIARKDEHTSTKGDALARIYLDLEHAELSAAGTFFDPQDFFQGKRLQAVRMTLIDRVNKVYLRNLVQEKLHILATVPIYSVDHSLSFYKLSSMNYTTYSVEGGELGTAQAEGRAEQMLFVLGMTGKNALPHIDCFIPSSRWIVHGSSSFSHGTMAVSSRAFTSRLYALLAEVNKLTTLVPVSPNAKSDPDADMVQQWATHPDFRDQSCEWSPVGSDGDRYEWKYSRDWSLREQGTKVSVKGEYSISCVTENELEIPDLAVLMNGDCLEVRMSGVIRLRIGSTRADNSWSTESAASWAVTLSLKTTSEGMVKIDIDGLDNIRHPPPKVTFRRGNFNMPDAYKILEKHLPSKKDFESVLNEFQELQGVWKYYNPSVDKFTLCSPTVNNDGDLLFELRRAPKPTPKFTRPATRPIWLKSASKVPTNGSSTVPIGNGTVVGTNGPLNGTATGTNGSSSPTVPTVGVKSSTNGTNGSANGSIPTPTTPTTTSGTKLSAPGTAVAKGATPASNVPANGGADGAGTVGNNGDASKGSDIKGAKAAVAAAA
ncbi:hypothetical protein L226DRAFT_482501 [Lentinus tigrinus ALCF2SS1-7]|uniref:Uncharacterized protein n=1 Tax=Lentinus tigrinus ALCF2SS1-6 TaxID=1328759 RepID=A0A5C2SFA3_9APHY|nr:hypothetical protein L227DRAFT_545038 [Lentinus tigrinus ALCF2SS1-6]RPD77768.1 hypothetical protein L226DRAFT_482501 [Lentinus tigrinus ALCF2SS1-7]